MGLNGCCCCFSLQTGVIILSVLEAIGGVLSIASGFSVTFTGLRVSSILYGVFALIAGVLGIMAVKKKSANFLLPLMVAFILSILQNVFVAIVGKEAYDAKTAEQIGDGALITGCVLASIVAAYFLAVVYYYYKSLKNEGRTINSA